MKKNLIYSSAEIKETYRQVHDLLVTKYIIKKYSTNNNDIREITVQGMDFSKVSHVLELGCGYGFFIEVLKNRLHENACIVGIDIVENNREAYLHTIEGIGYHGEFIQNDVHVIKDLESSFYDLVIASYSLYFFPTIIKQIARVLKPEGIFIVITHSKYSLKEIIDLIPGCMQEIGLSAPEKMSLHKLLETFSLENGKDLLNPYFNEVETILFNNSLRFSDSHVDDCMYYIEKKRQLLYKEIIEQYPEMIIDIESKLFEKICKQAKDYKEISITKDDAIFRCYNPIIR